MTDTPTFQIRDGRADERATAGELTLAAYGQYADLMAPDAWAALRGALVAALAAPGPVDHLVATQGEALVGSVFLFPATGGGPGGAGGRLPWPELRLLAVAPEARGRGVGEALVRACIARARQQGLPTIGLYSSASMRAALALYPKLGFIRAPELDFRPPSAELVMAYRLEI